MVREDRFTNLIHRNPIESRHVRTLRAGIVGGRRILPQRVEEVDRYDPGMRIALVHTVLSPHVSVAIAVFQGMYSSP